VGDQVAVEALLADSLGIERWASVIGGSMGGMRALEWLAAHPDRVESGLVLAVGAVASADQIATQTTQTLAITSDPRWNGGDYHAARSGEGPTDGLGIARRIAHLTYRSEAELEARFGAEAQDGENPLRDGRFAVQSYLDHHADKLAWRFDAGSYVALTDAMSTWDLGRGRGGVDAALASIRTPLVVAGIDSDRLYPVHQQHRIARAPGAVGGLRVIASPFGHDGFLVERDAVFALVSETLELALSRVR
jgi:homoserine O-acetyltransferase